MCEYYPCKICSRTVCKYLQPINTVNAAEIFQVYQKACVEMPDGTNAQIGDLVICSVNGKNFTEPCGLGKVIKVKDVKLSKHPDGPKGEVFVLSYDKQKCPSTSLATLKSKLLLTYLHILYCTSFIVTNLHCLLIYKSCIACLFTNLALYCFFCN